MADGKRRRGVLPLERIRAALAAILCLAISTIALPARAQGKDLLVFAAASLKNALDEIDAAYGQATGKTVKVAFAASSALAKQIEAGAPADIFISADLTWMDYLQQRRLIEPESRKNLLGNRLVLIAPFDGPIPQVTLQPGLDLAALLADGRLAMADTSGVPAGKYGKAALQSLGLWPAVASRLAQAENVRAALALVARGEAPLGIVYQTDAAVERNVRIVGMFPQDSHPPIVYPAAILSASRHPDAAIYFAFIGSAKARPLFEEQGFTVLP